MTGRARISRVYSLALEEAFHRAGGVKALAEHLGLSPQTVSRWVVCPPVRVLAVEKATGVSRHALRPDVFGEGV